VLLALGRLAGAGSSELPWTEARAKLADLIAEFGPSSRTGRAQSAAYPFTRLRTDGIWVLDQDVPMDLVGPLAREQVNGRFEESAEAVLLARPALIGATARDLVLSNFPATVAPDVLEAVGLDPVDVLGADDLLVGTAGVPGERRRDPRWRSAVLEAWDRQCAFCGYDGQVTGASVAIDAAHVRWFAFGGPDTLDNGLALCVLHHKLFDLGVLGLNPELQVMVSAKFSARTPVGRAIYHLHGHQLAPRPGTASPALTHVVWHTRQVFKGESLAA
jgi:putative restriction endonuclease